MWLGGFICLARWAVFWLGFEVGFFIQNRSFPGGGTLSPHPHSLRSRLNACHWHADAPAKGLPPLLTPRLLSSPRPRTLGVTSVVNQKLLEAFGLGWKTEIGRDGVVTSLNTGQWAWRGGCFRC